MKLSTRQALRSRLGRSDDHRARELLAERLADSMMKLAGAALVTLVRRAVLLPGISQNAGPLFQIAKTNWSCCTVSLADFPFGLINAVKLHSVDIEQSRLEIVK